MHRRRDNRAGGPATKHGFVENAHPFFWALVLALGVAALAAALASGRAPGYALHSEWVYRLLVGLAVFAGE